MSASEWNSGDYPKRLRRARQKAGLTQAELANRLGTKQFNISRIEGGQRPRKPLFSRITAFIEDTERPPAKAQDQIVSAIAHSDELKALIARIVAEL
ncbi:helix-turn-helix domain-containing protein [Breoghania sp. JC706]|uniref:helix-turn-helix domain-containing protein n=1 Tax=Breoghania sp. JC706 TaxID=3117732 RepID=UPI0030099F1F